MTCDQTRFRTLRRVALRTVAAAALGALALTAFPAPQEAVAQDLCSIDFSGCRADASELFDLCARRAADRDARISCRRRLNTFRRSCEADLRRCQRQEAAAAEAGVSTEAMISAAPAPSRQSARSASRRLEARLFLLHRGADEPEVAYYAYLVYGVHVAEPRKRAIAEAIACRIRAIGFEEAEGRDDLGLVVIPASRGRAPSEGDLTPLEFKDAYDTRVAERWLDAASEATGEDFDPWSAVLFIGSSKPLGEILGDRDLPADEAGSTYVIADASNLSPRYLRRWAFEVVDGVRQGEIKSRVDFQDVMEAHSWLEVFGSPIAAGLFKLAPSAQAAPATPCG